MPTIHVTNHSSRALHKGRVYTIMALPREWEHGEGTVRLLVPKVIDLRAVQSGALTMDAYRERYLAGLVGADLRPGVLATEGGTVLADGDTICCSCAKDEAAAGRCHRVWAAEELHAQGWSVVLDGRLVGGGGVGATPVPAGEPSPFARAGVEPTDRPTSGRKP